MEEWLELSLDSCDVLKGHRKEFDIDFILNTTGSQGGFLCRGITISNLCLKKVTQCWFMKELERRQEWQRREHMKEAFIALQIRSEVEGLKVGRAGGCI